MVGRLLLRALQVSDDSELHRPGEPWLHKGDILGLWHVCKPPARDLSLGKCQGESGSHELGGGYLDSTLL